MFTFEMKQDTFTVLNLTDPQLNECHWDPANPGYDHSYAVLDRTVRTLVDRVKPDLITVTGDLSMADQPKAYPALADYLDAFGIPWCVVWGNHDQQDVVERINFVFKILPYYRSRKHFFHDVGVPAIGNGNYIVAIQKNGKPVHALFMIDSHNCVWLPDDEGVKHFYYDKLNEVQIAWYKEQASMLKEKGCVHTSMLMHIPIHAYQDAVDAAFKPDIDTCKVTLEESYGSSCWNPGYEESYGVKYESGPIACYPYDDGVFAAIKEIGTTENVISGHIHTDNFVIPYQGVRLAFATKTGRVHPFRYPLNGGTVITVHADGHSDLRHEYVDIEDLLTEADPRF